MLTRGLFLTAWGEHSAAPPQAPPDAALGPVAPGRARVAAVIGYVAAIGNVRDVEEPAGIQRDQGGRPADSPANPLSRILIYPARHERTSSGAVRHEAKTEHRKVLLT